MADTKPTQEDQEALEIFKSWGYGERETMDRDSEEARAIIEAHKAEFDSLKDWGKDALVRFYSLPETVQPLLLDVFEQILARLNIKSEAERREAFLNSASYKAFKKLYPNVTLQYDNRLTGFLDGVADVYINIVFPEYIKRARPGATFSEVSGIPAESIKPGSLEAFQEALWNELYPPTTAPNFDDPESLFDEDFPTLESTGTPKRYTAPNTTLTNAMQNLDGVGEVIGAGKIELPVLKTPKEIIISVNASIVEGPEITGPQYDEYDRAIEAAIWSIYLDRTRNNRPAIATPEMIYRTMTHKTGAEAVSPQQIASIKSRIDKMRRIYLEIDATEEMLARINEERKGRPLESYTINGYLLQAIEKKVRIGNNIVDAYFFGEPLLLEYARDTKQIITINGSALAIKKLDSKGNITPLTVPNTESRIAAKFYLMRRIATMKNDEKRAAAAFKKHKEARARNQQLPEKAINDFRRLNRSIKLDTLFKAAGVTTKNSKTNMREYVYTVLDYWSATGEIKEYKKTKKKGRKTADAIEIILL